jgi:hypothetical protein
MESRHSPVNGEAGGPNDEITGPNDESNRPNDETGQQIQVAGLSRKPKTGHAAA